MTEKLTIGDPTERKVTLARSSTAIPTATTRLMSKSSARSGRILTGGKILTEGSFARGYFVAPTLVADLPLEHRLWKEEMFVPDYHPGEDLSLDEAMKRPTMSPTA